MGFWKEFKEAKKKAEEIINAKKSQSLDLFKEVQKNTMSLNNIAKKKIEELVDNHSNIVNGNNASSIQDKNEEGLSSRLESLIQAALQDGVLTPKEREIILRRAEKDGEDVDEIEMLLDSRLAELRNQQTLNDQKVAGTGKPLVQNSNSVTTDSIITKNYNKDEVLVIPSGTKEVTTATVPEKSIKQVIIPASVEKIGMLAFGECDELESVVFEENCKLKEIGRSAFCKCPLKSINIPSSVRYIRYQAFRECKKLESIVFEDGSNLEVIEHGAFVYCSSLKSVTIPSSVEKIDEHAFRESPKLETVIFEDNGNLEIIGKCAFLGCPLKSIIIPSSVRIIDDDAFHDCSKLESVVFEENSSLTNISKGVFCGCNRLKSIIIPASVESISRNAFRDCKNLESVAFEEDSYINEIKFTAFENSKNTVLRLPTSAEELKEPCDIHRIYVEDKKRGVLKLKSYGMIRGNDRCIVIPNGVTEVMRDSLRGDNYSVYREAGVFLPPTLIVFTRHSHTFSTIYLYSPNLESLDFIGDCREKVNLYVLPQYLDRYIAQRDAEGISERELIINPMPDEYLYYYENE